MNPGARMGKMHGYTSKNGMGSYLLTESRFLTFSAEVETEIAKKISVRSFHLSREKDGLSLSALARRRSVGRGLPTAHASPCLSVCLIGRTSR